MLNPGGSVKDRIGLPMIEAAERAGLLKPGGTIIEPTSGNTGHGLAIAAALKGYRCIFVMADKQSSEKQQLLRAYGAEVVLCPTNVAPGSPESYYSVAARLARDIPGAFKPDQYWNMENPAAHERTTGPELWEQTDGRITHFVASVGTGGTISGAARALKARNPAIRVIGADPEGSVLSGDTARPYLTEGVGEDFLPGTYDPSMVDRWVRVSDRDAFAMARRLTREEGILAGGSCGTALVAARVVVRELTEAEGGHKAVVVVLLPDSGRNYLSKIYNDEWMRANGLLATTGATVRVAELLADRHHDADLPQVVLARTTDRVGAAIDLLQLYGISQLPVSEQAESDALEGIVGSVSERGLLERAFRDPSVVERTVGEVMDPPLPLVEASATLDAAFALLSGGAAALVAIRGDRPVGVVTKLDFLEYLAHRPMRSA
jgi:cystathionine beta-synthase